MLEVSKYVDNLVINLSNQALETQLFRCLFDFTLNT